MWWRGQMCNAQFLESSVNDANGNVRGASSPDERSEIRDHLRECIIPHVASLMRATCFITPEAAALFALRLLQQFGRLRLAVCIDHTGFHAEVAVASSPDERSEIRDHLQDANHPRMSPQRVQDARTTLMTQAGCLFATSRRPYAQP